ncbi:MAG: cell division protein FtsL [Gammaproteobacteria bacterium]
MLTTTYDSSTEISSEISEKSWLTAVSWKTVVVISLFLSLWLSAFAVVYTTNAARHTFAELQSLRQEHDNLFLDWTQLLLEQSAWTDTGQIEQLAREELHMHAPTTEESNFLVVRQ